jgi:hypothetical protein
MLGSQLASPETGALAGVLGRILRRQTVLQWGHRRSAPSNSKGLDLKFELDLKIGG